jgi:hypothetical protein
MELDIRPWSAADCLLAALIREARIRRLEEQLAHVVGAYSKTHQAVKQACLALQSRPTIAADAGIPQALWDRAVQAQQRSQAEFFAGPPAVTPFVPPPRGEDVP